MARVRAWRPRHAAELRVVIHRKLSAAAVIVAMATIGVGLGYFIGFGPRGDAARLSSVQRAVMDEAIDVFEHDTRVPQYGYVADQHDGRGLSAGTGGFATADGGLLFVVQDYLGRVRNSGLSRYVPALRQIATAHGDGREGLDGFEDAWRAASADPAMRTAQDDAMTRLFFQPAMRRADQLKIRSALGRLMLYDAAVQHGFGRDPDSLDGLIERNRKALGDRAEGIGERGWLERFLTVRRTALLQPADPARTEAWANSAGRVDALRALLTQGSDRLSPPLMVNPYGTPHVLTGRSTDIETPPTPSDAPPYVVWFAANTPSAAPPSTTPSTTPSTAPSASPQARPSPPPDTIVVSTVEELRNALASVQPGQTIRLNDGVYRGVFEADHSGTEAKPITVTGSSNAVLTGSGIGFYLRANYWRLTGFTVSNAAYGVLLDGANHNVLDGLSIHDIANEGVHFRTGSSYNTLSHSTIRNTGQAKQPGGHAISIGTTVNQWSTISGGQPDRSDHNQVIGNTVGPGLYGSIQADEGSTGGVIASNSIDGAGMGLDITLIMIRGNGYQVTGNSGVSAPQHGIIVTQRLSPWGCGAEIRGNHLDVRASGYGIQVYQSDTCVSTVYSDNVAVNAGSGLTNVQVRPA